MSKIFNNIEITDIASGGLGVGKFKNKVVFVQKAIPGDIINVEKIKEKKTFINGKIYEIVQPSPLRKKALCPHFDICGGCKWQITDYKNQLDFKTTIVRKAFQYIGKIDIDGILEEIIPCEEQYFYRNKMEFSFAPSEENFLSLGLHLPGKWNEVFDVKTCKLFDEKSNEILEFVRKITIDRGIQPYDNYENRGILRFLMVRRGVNTGHYLINLVSTGEKEEQLNDILMKVSDKFEFVTTVVHNISKRKAAIAVGEKEKIISGDGYIIENLLGKNFKISANTFFQSNTKQAEKLFSKAIEIADFTKSQRVLELYSGTGAISILLSPYVKEIIGIEIVEDSVKRAMENLELNGVRNCKFLVGDTAKIIGNFENDFFDAVVVDPPRPGLAPKVVQTILNISPEKILYISCNPDTLARDIALFTNRDLYSLKRLIPVDMFPQTHHIETIALLEKSG